MLRLLLPALAAFGSFGCLTFPDARLSTSQSYSQQVAAPVVCGPMGFRKTPLQARWGEYVRVTVASQVTLRGSALLHANGATFEPRAWRTDHDGELVLEARFENLDPDARFALSTERPIDITLTGLEAPAGGSCEGAIFTVEQGALVPSIGERAWLAELERRGGPELAARRAAAKLEAEARREAHYAAWAARQQVQVSAELVAQAEVARLEHYAAWEARRLGEVLVDLGATARVEAEVTTVTEGYASAHAEGAVVSGVGATLGGSTTSSSTSTVVSGAAVSAYGAADTMWGGTIAGGAAHSGGTSITGDTVVSASGACGVPVFAESAGSGGAGVASTSAPGATSCMETTTVNGGTAVESFTEVAQVSTRVSAEVAVSAPTEWASFEADVAWTQPADAQLRATMTNEWEQPYAARLDAVAVTTESKVAVGTPPPLPPPAPTCPGNCGARAEMDVAAALPAVLELFARTAAWAATLPPPPQRVIQAVPVGTR